MSAPSNKPLNVRDALSYLDEVKSQFADQPAVYNRFLDVMKSFKNNSIDTPGVIHRVSSLFRGHSSLIKAFQTFLPPGYKLDCSEEGQDAQLIITTPNGGTITHALPMSNDISIEQRIAEPIGPAPIVATTAGRPPPSSAPLAAASEPQPTAAPPTVPAPSTGTPGPVATPGVITAAGALKQPLEFNHAINYVNKIKQRFSGDPQTYKVFLEILQTYQKEQKPIQEVYAEVTQLFASAPDLLDEFKRFLPDDPTMHGQSSAYAGEKRPAPPAAVGPRKKPKTSAPSALTAVAQSQEDKRRSKKAQAHPPGKPGRRKAYTPPPLSPQPEERVPVGAPSPFARGHVPITAEETLVSMDDLAFFDRVKRYVEHKSVYQEFLKLLNLYTFEIIDLPTLVNQAYLFFGQSEQLFPEFKSLVGWDPTVHGPVDDEEWIVDNVDALDRPRVDLNNLQGHGPSYKRLPASEVQLACSGRDALCWSVLNDDWVAHATWASEGSGAHKKNLSEEALSFCEQERHWFSVVMETNLRAIAILDPLCHRIDQMDAQERASFRLQPGFGGSHRSVVERAIKKIYGSDAFGAAAGTRTDHASELIQALYEAPGTSVPIILSRMKQKDQDWKRALAEWNKVWREVDAKNFYRALDHQSGSYKVNDKKTLTTKSLVAEIEQLRADQQQKLVAAPGAPIERHPQRRKFQFELHMEDKNVLFDLLKLTLAYLDRSVSGYSAPERERVEGFLRLFIPLVFGISKEEVEAQLGEFIQKHSDEEDEEHDSEAEDSDASGTSATESRAGSSTSRGSSKGAKRLGPKAIAADLRRRLLSSHLKQAKTNGAVNNNTAAQQTIKVDEHRQSLLQDTATWIQADAAPYDDSDGESDQRRSVSVASTEEGSPAPPRDPNEKQYHFFCGSMLYSFVRSLHIFYQRLLTLKRSAQEAADQNAPARVNPLAVDLGMGTLHPIIDIPTVPGVHPATRYYEHMLELCEKMFDHELDASQFEEYLRYMWGTKAFPMFTVDRLVSNLIKLSHAINNDAQCQDMLLLLERNRQREHVPFAEVAYRMEVEQLLAGDDTLYRVQWFQQDNALCIQLLGKSDLTVHDKLQTRQQRFDYYLASYTLPMPTEGIHVHVRAPLLRRNFKLAKGSAQHAGKVVASTNAAVRIGLDTYKLFHVAGTGDCMVRRPASKTIGDPGIDQKRKERFRLWLDDLSSMLED